MGDNDGGQMKLPGDGLDPVLDGLFDDAVQGGQGLIQQENPGLHHHGPGQGYPLLLPAGELVHPLGQMLPQAQQMDQLLHLFLAGDSRLVFQAVGNILVDIEIGEQGIILKDNVKAPLLHGGPGQILPVVANGSRVRLHNA